MDDESHIKHDNVKLFPTKLSVAFLINWPLFKFMFLTNRFILIL